MSDFVAIDGRLGPSDEVVISEKANSDLKAVNGLTRRLLLRTLRDELLAPTTSSKIETAGDRDLYLVKIGDYSALFRPDAAYGGDGARIVERVVRSNDVGGVLDEEGAAAASADASSSAAQS